MELPDLIGCHSEPNAGIVVPSVPSETAWWKRDGFIVVLNRFEPLPRGCMAHDATGAIDGLAPFARGRVTHE